MLAVAATRHKPLFFPPSSSLPPSAALPGSQRRRRWENVLNLESRQDIEKGRKKKERDRQDG
jgi:hypothetical protein